MTKWQNENGNTWRSNYLAVHFVEVLAQICVLLSTFGTLQLKRYLRIRKQLAKHGTDLVKIHLVSFVNKSYVLSEITVLLSTNRTWSTTLKVQTLIIMTWFWKKYFQNLIVDICDVSFKIRLQVTTVATVTTLVFLQLKQEVHELGLMAGRRVDIAWKLWNVINISWLCC